MSRLSSILLVIVILLGGLAVVGNLGFVHAVDITGIDDPYAWSMFGGNPAHSGYSLSVGTTGNQSQLLWNYTLAITAGWTPGAMMTAPIVVQDKIYVGLSKNVYGNGVYCFDAFTGVILWRNLVGNVSAVPAIDNSLIFASLDNGTLWCFDANNGEWMWQLQGTSTTLFPVASFAPLTAADGRLFAATVDGSIYCINEVSGQLIWNSAIGGNLSSVSVANARAYVASTNGRIYCFNAQTGKENWNYTAESQVRCSPAVVEGRVYFGADDSHVYCLNASSGTMLWKYHVPTNAPIRGSLAVAYHRVYASSTNRVYCIDVDSGSQIWTYTTDSDALPPIVADGFAYVNTKNSFYQFNAVPGTLYWNYQFLRNATPLTPVLGDTMLVEAYVEGTIIVFVALPYHVTFTQSSLPLGTTWNVTLSRWDNLTISSTSNLIRFPISYVGQYSFLIEPPSGYTSNYSSSQPVTFNTIYSNVNIPVDFTRIPEITEVSDLSWAWALEAAVTLTATIAAITLAKGAKEKTSNKRSEPQPNSQ